FACSTSERACPDGGTICSKGFATCLSTCYDCDQLEPHLSLDTHLPPVPPHRLAHPSVRARALVPAPSSVPIAHPALSPTARSRPQSSASRSSARVRSNARCRGREGIPSPHSSPLLLGSECWCGGGLRPLLRKFARGLPCYDAHKRD